MGQAAGRRGAGEYLADRAPQTSLGAPPVCPRRLAREAERRSRVALRAHG